MKFLNYINTDSNNTVITHENKKYGWVEFGSNDRYPLDLVLNIDRSAVGSSVVETLASFIKGGKLPPEIANIKVNDRLTFEELHDSLSYDFAINFGCYANVKYNQLGNITELDHISYEHTRATIPDDNGYISSYQYLPELYSYRKKKELHCIKYDVYNPDAALTQMQGKDFYNGQIKAIKLMRPNATGQRVYPIPSINSALSYLEIDYRMGNYHVNSIKNNFHKSHIFIVKGVNPDEKDPETNELLRDRIEGEINQMIGDDSAGGIFIQYVQNQNESIEIIPVESTDDDKKYTTLDGMVVSKIATASNVPPILANIQTAGKLGDSQEIQNAVAVLNGKTQKFRAKLESFYNEVAEKAQEGSPLKALQGFEIPLFDYVLSGGNTQENNIEEDGE